KYAKYNRTDQADWAACATGNVGDGGVKTTVALIAGGVSVTFEEILKTFNAPISKDQAWVLIYQASRTYKTLVQQPECRLCDLRLSLHLHQVHLQKDVSCIVTARTDKELCFPSTQKKPKKGPIPKFQEHQLKS
uniref:KIND domain-containing protein n=1 Tax=Anopheles farauti TaxID=69004 RepID=A0A182QAA5_9DIPT